ncbi:hypothetical protein FIBSPDRAFT_200168 [Athelia psychrophila]|uniref:Carbamoyl-phosphate synthetase large subunit-like ATP-binding domain-containing protein n=1 Tax=Athelia psychrophila TaxID=1759441 RepID=A0A165ZP90_9AGAM|nr:hypothetical protein FIBSPDRAFT_200168 [Fibularhizoctonia sp. CBS 109695]
MACALRHQGVGTFAYLENSRSGDWVFLEINPVHRSSMVFPSRGPQGAECTLIRGGVCEGVMWEQTLIPFWQ